MFLGNRLQLFWGGWELLERSWQMGMLQVPVAADQEGRTQHEQASNHFEQHFARPVPRGSNATIRAGCDQPSKAKHGKALKDDGPC
jgi:hypothetical protein